MVSFGEGKKNVKEKEKRRGRERGDQAKIKAKKVWNFGFLVWKLTFLMNSMRFGMDLWVCMMIILLKPRVLLEFHLNPKIMESKLGKTLNRTRNI